MAKYADLARERIQKGLKKYTPVLTQAKTRSSNEADARDIVKAVLADLLGWDPFFEVTGEFSIKGQYADFAVKADDQIQFFVEVKSIDTKLDEKHLYQVIGYAANHGIEWAVLTNGETWNIYRLFAGEERKTEVVTCFSLVDKETGPSELVERLFLISKEGFRQQALGTHWANMQALHPKKVVQALFEPSVIKEEKPDAVDSTNEVP